ncbi:hypothetical protein AMK21_20535 [Streptomyces sp. CB00316]|uniref:DUF4184 family protein n=1 Tax=unclassified Streptomyces TaxID=2593676 RepID=UPI00093A5925|nr:MULTISPECIES: DUF4184 family protein [unclassified Streptomyces]MBT2377215.1 DUF4184 family protein [Streptomyces sp. ISL-111]OKJ18636.1 hypothetical protein AMK21_20535 [Streptomyces sp. CB00316]
MPFTLSHAAAVLPAIRRNGTARWGLFPSALVAGSFAPDVTYFADTVIPGAMRFGDFTHTFLGVVTVNVLIAAVLVAVWAALREPLVALLPVRVRSRVHTFVRGQRWNRESFGPSAWLCFARSAALGAATHVVWDAFTHHSRWGTELLPFLNRSVGGFPLYQFAQYGSSAVALAVLVRFVATGLRRTAEAPVPEALRALGRGERWGALGLLAGCVVLGIVHRCVRFLTHFGRIENPLDIIPTACFGAGAGLGAGLLLYGVWMRLLRRRRPAEDCPGQVPVADEARTEASTGRK